jgi:hypothetical protein
VRQILAGKLTIRKLGKSEGVVGLTGRLPFLNNGYGSLHWPKPNSPLPH